MYSLYNILLLMILVIGISLHLILGEYNPVFISLISIY